MFALIRKDLQPLAFIWFDLIYLVQNAAAWVLTKNKRRANITHILKSLHWLPVSFRIDFKILLLVFKSVNGNAPAYISAMLPEYVPCRALRSSSTGLLEVPETNTKKYGEAAFSYYAPTLWNSLPGIYGSLNLWTFLKAILKHTFLAFTQTFLVITNLKMYFNVLYTYLCISLFTTVCIYLYIFFFYLFLVSFLLFCFAVV